MVRMSELPSKPILSDCGHDPAYPAPYPSPGSSIFCYRCDDWTSVSKDFRVNYRDQGLPRPFCRARGHAMTEENTYIRLDNSRECLECKKVRNRQSSETYRKKKMAENFGWREKEDKSANCDS